MLQNWQIKTKLSKFRAMCSCAQCGADYEASIYDARKSQCGHLCNRCKTRISSLTELTQEALLELFEYDPESGIVRQKLDTRGGRKGDVVSYPHSQGYLTMLIGGREYLVHRVIWFMMTGTWPHQVDHIDHDRINNAWGNLREIAPIENQKNMSKKCSNTSGITGVRVLPSGKFWAYIMVNRKQISLGSHDDIEQAKAARQAAEERYGFHANHGT